MWPWFALHAWASNKKFWRTGLRISFIFYGRLIVHLYVFGKIKSKKHVFCSNQIIVIFFFINIDI
jgi:hypothetical protein